MKKLFIFLIIFTACAPQYVWVRKDYTPQLFYRDKSECMIVAQKAAGPFNYEGRNQFLYKMFCSCMIGRGWVLQRKEG